MLHRLLFLCVAMSAGVLFAPPLCAQPTFELFVPGLVPARIETVAFLPDRGFYVLGESWENEVKQGMLLRFASDGSLVWSREFVMRDKWIEPYSVSPLPNGDVLITGGITPTGEERRERNDLLAARLNSEGTLLWANVYKSGKETLGFHTAPLNDGSVIISGSRQPGLEDSIRTLTLMFRIDTAGNVMWANGMYEEDSEKLYFLSIGSLCRTTGGMLAGTAAFTTIENIESAMSMTFQITPEGIPSTGNTFVETSEEAPLDYSYFHAITTDPDGGAVAVGLAQTGGADLGLVVKTNAEGTPEWGRLYEEAQNFSPRMSGVFRAENRIVLGGGWYRPLLMEADSQGTLRKTIEWDPFSGEQDNSETKRTAYVLSYPLWSYFNDGSRLFAAHIDSTDGSNGTLITLFAPDFSTCGGTARQVLNTGETNDTPVRFSDIRFREAMPLSSVPLPLSVDKAEGFSVREKTARPVFVCRKGN